MFLGLALGWVWYIIIDVIRTVCAGHDATGFAPSSSAASPSTSHLRGIAPAMPQNVASSRLVGLGAPGVVSR